MSAAPVLTPLPKLSADDLDDRDRYEIIDGVKVEMPPMSTDSTAVGAELARLLGNYGVDQNLGRAYPEMLIKLRLPKDRNRRPDVIFVPYTQWGKGVPFPSTNAWDVLPNLCVEVVSPNDGADEIETKIEEYFQAGVQQVWVVYPRHDRVYVYESPALIRRLTPADTLDGGPVLPGFRLPLTELFPAPPAQ
jgi:Uma2 family endonuclease